MLDFQLDFSTLRIHKSLHAKPSQRELNQSIEKRNAKPRSKLRVESTTMLLEFEELLSQKVLNQPERSESSKQSKNIFATTKKHHCQG